MAAEGSLDTWKPVMVPQAALSATPTADPRESPEQRLRIIRPLPDVVFQIEKRADGHIDWTFNEGRLADEFHLTTDDTKDKPLEALFPPETVSRLLPEFERAFNGEAREFTHELGGHFLKVPPAVVPATPARGRTPRGRVRASARNVGSKKLKEGMRERPTQGRAWEEREQDRS